jgi:hypothetical protein
MLSQRFFLIRGRYLSESRELENRWNSNAIFSSDVNSFRASQHFKTKVRSVSRQHMSEFINEAKQQIVEKRSNSNSSSFDANNELKREQSLLEIVSNELINEVKATDERIPKVRRSQRSEQNVRDLSLEFRNRIFAGMQRRVPKSEVEIIKR